jgi:hypothetical protein
MIDSLRNIGYMGTLDRGDRGQGEMRGIRVPNANGNGIREVQ